MVDRASPAQQRKAMEIANLFTKSGIGFVPMPVNNSAEFDRLAQQSIEILMAMVSDAEHQDAETKPRVPDGVYDNSAKMRREEWKNGELVRWVTYRMIAAAPPGQFAEWQTAPDLPKGTES